jgi:hypothetical protein
MMAGLLQQLTRDNVFFPLLKATQPHFEKARYRLWAGEAVAVAKLMTLVLETGPLSPAHPRWPDALNRLVGANPQAANPANIEALLGKELYPELAYDAAIWGFTTLMTFTGEDFGSPEEMAEYADGLANSVSGSGDPLDLIHAYLPLVLGGIAINAQVVMPGEDPRDTMRLYARARDKRAGEGDEGSQFIIDLADNLIAT